MTEKTKETIRKVAWTTLEVILEAGAMAAAAWLGAEVGAKRICEAMKETAEEA